MRAVDSVLEEIGAGDTPRVLVFNKLDLLGDEERRDLLVGSGEAIGISAAKGEGIEELLDAIEEAFAATLEPMELLIPYDDGAVLSELHAIAGQVDREDRAGRRRRPGPGSAQPLPPFRGYSTGGVGDVTAA